ncbi:hypothetical protein [Methylorubrum aminovorans]|uniref:hypothetical protein n=1 Tax=Methylorubrum aminovorans TaxID=269069 RepID=UPI0024E18265|nr:hypothetical protein [Methylorubrum aminovorans]
MNTARFLTGEEPVEVYAWSYAPPNDPRFASVEETVSFQLRFLQLRRQLPDQLRRP